MTKAEGTSSLLGSRGFSVSWAWTPCLTRASHVSHRSVSPSYPILQRTNDPSKSLKNPHFLSSWDSILRLSPGLLDQRQTGLCEGSSSCLCFSFSGQLLGYLGVLSVGRDLPGPGEGGAGMNWPLAMGRGRTVPPCGVPHCYKHGEGRGDAQCLLFPVNKFQTLPGIITKEI